MLIKTLRGQYYRDIWTSLCLQLQGFPGVEDIHAFEMNADLKKKKIKLIEKIKESFKNIPWKVLGVKNVYCNKLMT